MAAVVVLGNLWQRECDRGDWCHARTAWPRRRPCTCMAQRSPASSSTEDEMADARLEIRIDDPDRREIERRMGDHGEDNRPRAEQHHAEYEPRHRRLLCAGQTLIVVMRSGKHH